MDFLSKALGINENAVRLFIIFPIVAACASIAYGFFKDGTDVNTVVIMTGLIATCLTILMGVIPRILNGDFANLSGPIKVIAWFITALFCVICTLSVLSAFNIIGSQNRIFGGKKTSDPIVAAATHPILVTPLVATTAKNTFKDKSRFTVYTQFYGYSRDELEKSLKAPLLLAEWKVPGLERIDSARDLNEIRYKSADQKLAAEALLGDLLSQGYRGIKLKEVKAIDSKILELWISR